MRKVYVALVLMSFTILGQAQEFDAKVTVVSKRVGTTVSQSTFRTLQTALNNFINTRKWTSDVYAPKERIECNFLLNLELANDANYYKGSLTIQAARLVFNSSYLSPIMNYKDDDIYFKYIEFQQLEFNENRVGGTDAAVANLTAIFAYYAYMILGFDGDSFAPNGGAPYFQKAQNIVNNAPDGRGMAGWKAFDGLRNRYWLVENMSNSRYALIHDIYYNYYRMVMDKLYDKPKVAQGELMNVLNQLDNFNSQNPNTMINQFFFQGRATEMIQILSKADPALKVRAKEILPRVDVTNAQKYNDEIK